MFYQNRFTERARQALTLAQEAAASFGHSYIGLEHLLLGLLREGGGPAAKANAFLFSVTKKFLKLVKFHIVLL